MNEEIEEYVKYLSSFSMVEKPVMPKFNISAYTDNEYLNAIYDLMEDFDNVFDEYLTIDHLKGK